MDKRTLGVAISVFLVMSLFVLALNVQRVRAATWYVNASGGGDFTKIQDAINAASPGDTIVVLDGTYPENVVVNKRLTLVGENSQEVAIDGGNDGNTVNVTANGVTIDSFTITDSGSAELDCGVFLNNVADSKIVNCNVSYNNRHGILVFGTNTRATISGNTIQHDLGNGIILDSAYQVLIESNTITTNNGNGTWAMGGSQNFAVRHNSVTSNGEAGLAFENSNYSSIVENDIVSNGQDGISLWSSHSVVAGNNITTDGDGFWDGLFITNSTDVRVYHNNFVDNNRQAEEFLGCSSISWDDGYPSGGNYWNEFGSADSFSGPYQNVTGSDGIWDTRYNITVTLQPDNQDHYPLVNPWGSSTALAVRGSFNDVIWYRFLDSSTGDWDSWNAVPTGSTVDSPAVAVSRGRLYTVVRGADGRSLWFSSINLTDSSFSGWTLLSGSSPSSPTLVKYNLKLILVVRGFSQAIYYRIYDIVTDVWGDWNVVPNSWTSVNDGATCDSPAAAVIGTTLHFVVRGFSTVNAAANVTLWHCSVDLTDNSFSGWELLTGWSSSAPRLAAAEALNRLYLTVRGGDNRIWINTWNGGVWAGWTPLPDGTTNDSPTMTVANGELHIVVRNIQGTTLWHYYIDVTTNIQSGWISMSGSTPSKPTLTG